MEPDCGVDRDKLVNRSDREIAIQELAVLEKYRKFILTPHVLIISIVLALKILKIIQT